MKCETIRRGAECVFMTSKGCAYPDGACREIVPACQGCNRVVTVEAGQYCNSCPDPAKKWKNGFCNLASNAARVIDRDGKGSGGAVNTMKKTNPQKAAKRAARGK